jgi:hypothetical protein
MVECRIDSWLQRGIDCNLLWKRQKTRGRCDLSIRETKALNGDVFSTSATAHASQVSNP